MIGSQGRSAGIGKRLLSVTEAAEYLGRTPWGIRGLIDNGKIPVVRIDRRVQIDRHDLDRIIEMSKVTTLD
jgi:excisionase family DNA binding protein